MNDRYVFTGKTFDVGGARAACDEVGVELYADPPNYQLNPPNLKKGHTSERIRSTLMRRRGTTGGTGIPGRTSIRVHVVIGIILSYCRTGSICIFVNKINDLVEVR